ncbi:glycosyltransferase family 4 protein [Micavibrio aeruginosavorus]|uniref:Glycosyltransferase n=1 Tax=Micavibrio aeruginosavorus EPB TaxID=349215 RepID=M4VDP8_9BACT|nr:glycosyltransferase family 1 protein [Micavibrio aeruginosavorus]AGH97353.1 Glycosyltransferase [Micavibrio aeruginosavorus EPB]
MRIVIISDAWKPQINGVVRTYELMIPDLERMGHDVHVIGPADFPKRFPMPGYREIELVMFPRTALAQKIEALAPDSIHIATEGPLGWAARGLCRARGWAYTTAYHTQFPDYTALRAAKFLPFLYNPVRNFCIALVRKFHAHSHAVMTTTQSIEDQLRHWKIETPFHRVTRGIDKNIFYPRTHDHAPVVNIPNAKSPMAVYVGRVAIEKNIRAFLDMHWDGSKMVVGDGPDRAQLMRDYPHVHFAGKQVGHDLAAHYRAGDVFVFPSKTDTFGIVLIEAMACGLPIAGYPVPGPMDIVTDDTLGALDDDLEIATHKAMGHGTAEGRYAHVLHHYTWDQAASQFAEMQHAALIKA